MSIMDQVERLPGLRSALDEVHRKVGEVLVDVPHLLGRLKFVGNPEIAALLSFDDSVVFAQALERLQAFGVQHQLRVFCKIHVLRVFADDRQKAAELVVADILRLHPLGFTDMPLARQPGDVTVLAQQLCRRDLVGPCRSISLSKNTQLAANEEVWFTALPAQARSALSRTVG